MMGKRSKRRDDSVDAIGTILWYRGIGDEIESYQPRDIQRFLEPEIPIGVWKNQYLTYRTGDHLPRKRILDIAEQRVPGSSQVLGHPLWDVLRWKKPLAKNTALWISQLDVDIQQLVLNQDRTVRLHGGDKYWRAFESRAGLDALAALTIVYRLNNARRNYEGAWLAAQSIFRVLLILTVELKERGVDQLLINVYEERVFRWATWGDMSMVLGHYDFALWSSVLLECAIRLEAVSVKRTSIPHTYSVKILRGEGYVVLFPFFQPFFYPNYQIGPPSAVNLQKASDQAKLQIGAAGQILREKERLLKIPELFFLCEQVQLLKTHCDTLRQSL